MGCFCGACGAQIGSARENGGSFQTNGEDFGGWDADAVTTEPNVIRDGRARVSDTCSACATALRNAVTEAARKIARKNRERIVDRMNEVTFWRKQQERHDEEKKEFEREWEARRRERGV